MIGLGWVCSHSEALPAFESAMAEGYLPNCIVTLDAEARKYRSSSVDFEAIAVSAGIPCLTVASIKEEYVEDWLRSFDLDLLIVLGWNQILPKELLDIPVHGAIGAHASLLPAMRGSAPVNWALIRGMDRTGNTLMRLSRNVDDGDILAQREIKIDERDTCATVYEKVGETNREMLLETLRRLKATGSLQATPQGPSPDELLPRRRPADGLIDWSLSSVDVYNFIRAITRPYPGAFTMLDGRRCTIWEASKLPESLGIDAKPGTIVGHLIGPGDAGVVVACGRGAVVITEIEDDDGRSYMGAALDDFGSVGNCFSTH